MILAAPQTYSQQEDKADITSGLTKFITWISGIDKILTGIDNRETLYALDRNLGYASLYIDGIATGKILLAKEISDLKANEKDNLRVDSLANLIDQIVADINNLSTYLKKIKLLLSKTNQNEIDSIIRDIEQGFQSRKLVFLKDIKDGIYSENISYDKITKEADESKKIAETALMQIKIAKDSIVSVLRR